MWPEGLILSQLDGSNAFFLGGGDDFPVLGADQTQDLMDPRQEHYGHSLEYSSKEYPAAPAGSLWGYRSTFAQSHTAQVESGGSLESVHAPEAYKQAVTSTTRTCQDMLQPDICHGSLWCGYTCSCFSVSLLSRRTGGRERGRKGGF